MDLIRFTADASNVLTVTDSVKNALRGIGDSIKGVASTRLGDAGGILPELKGERAVKGQAKFLVTSMLEARDATSAAESALQAFIYSSKVGLGASVAAVALVTAYKLITDQIEALTAAKKTLDESFSTSALTSGQSPEALGKQQEQQSAKLEAFRKITQAVSNVWVDLFRNKPTEGGFGLGSTIREGNAARTQEVMEEEKKVTKTAEDRAAAELAVARAKKDNVHLSESENELARLTEEHQRKRADLASKAVVGGVADQSIPGRIKASFVDEENAKDKVRGKEAKRIAESKDFEMKNLDDYFAKKLSDEQKINQIDYEDELKYQELLHDAAIADAKEAQEAANKARDILTLKKNPNDPTGLFGDIGGIAQDKQGYLNKLKAQQDQEAAGRQLLEEAKQAQAMQEGGIPTNLSPQMAELYSRVLEADRTQSKATSLQDLAQMDFSAVAELGDPKLDFSGIQSLSGLSIVVQ